MNNQTTFISRDLSLVAYLMASGFQLASYKQTDDGPMLFSFVRTDALNQHIGNFYRMTALINPTVYNNTLRSLKTMLHSNEHDEDGMIYEKTTCKTINERKRP